MRVFLIGFPGSGKTTVGRRLSEGFKRPFLDMDQQMEDFSGLSIPSLFSQYGEPYFRELERTVLHSLLNAPPNAIIATGGGAPCFFDNMDWMNTHGLTVWLNVPAEEIIRRLKMQRNKRPLFSNLPDQDFEPEIIKLMALREPYYRRAKVHIEEIDPEVISLYFSSLLEI